MKGIYIKRLLFALASVVALAIPAAAQEQADTTANSTELQEVVIEGRTRKAIDNGFSILPSKNDKKFSKDAYELIKNIQIPGIRTEGETVSNAMNQNVALYINYIPCSNLEARTLQTKDVIRVEYLESPADARFGGNLFVINFIVKEYEYGGYTTLQAGEDVTRFAGQYLLASKLSYKKTDINLFLGDNPFTDSHVESESIETFRDVTFNGEHYDEITRKSDLKGKHKSNNAYATLMIRNKLKGTNYMKHTISFQANRSPETEQHGSIFYSPEIIDQDLNFSSSSNKQLSPSISGYYLLGPGSYNVGISWGASYLDNQNRSTSKQGDFESIINNTNEKAVSGNADVSYYRYFGNNIIKASLSTELTRYKTTYFGTTDSRQRLFRTTNYFTLAYRRTFSSSMYLDAGASLNLFTTKVNDFSTEKSWKPSVRLFYGWTINQNHRFSALASLSFGNVPTDYLADVMLRTDPLKWQKGNPDLKNSLSTCYQISYSWIPNDKLSISVSPTLTLSKNSFASFWTANNDGGGVCMNYINLSHDNSFGLPVDVYWRPNNIFSLSGRIIYSHYNMKGSYKRISNTIQGDMRANIYLGNFSFGPYVTAPYKYKNYDYTDYGYWQWGLNASYSVGDLYCSVMFMNPFLNERNKWRSYSTPHYSSEQWRKFSRRSIYISISYTIKYGKKVSNDGIMSGGSSIGSSVLGGKQD